MKSNIKCTTYIYIYGILLMLLLAGCGTTKRIGTGTAGMELLSKGDFLDRYETMSEPSVVDARGKVSANLNGKEFNVATRWSLEYGKAFVLSLRPLGIMEIGRLTVVPEKVVVLDRANRQGIEVDDPIALIEQELDLRGASPKVLSALVHHRPFSFKEEGGTVLKKMKFTISEEGNYLFSEKKGKEEITHIFDRGLNLIRSSITSSGVQIGEMLYSDFVSVTAGTRPYPTKMELKVDDLGGARIMSVLFRLDQPSTRISQDVDTTLPSNYKRISPSQLKDLINDLNK